MRSGPWLRDLELRLQGSAQGWRHGQRCPVEHSGCQGRSARDHPSESDISVVGWLASLITASGPINFVMHLEGIPAPEAVAFAVAGVGIGAALALALAWQHLRPPQVEDSSCGTWTEGPPDAAMRRYRATWGLVVCASVAVCGLLVWQALLGGVGLGLAISLAGALLLITVALRCWLTVVGQGVTVRAVHWAGTFWVHRWRIVRVSRICPVSIWCLQGDNGKPRGLVLGQCCFFRWGTEPELPGGRHRGGGGLL